MNKFKLGKLLKEKSPKDIEKDIRIIMDLVRRFGDMTDNNGILNSNVMKLLILDKESNND